MFIALLQLEGRALARDFSKWNTSIYWLSEHGSICRGREPVSGDSPSGRESPCWRPDGNETAELEPRSGVSTMTAPIGHVLGEGTLAIVENACSGSSKLASSWMVGKCEERYCSRAVRILVSSTARQSGEEALTLPRTREAT